MFKLRFLICILLTVMLSGCSIAEEWKQSKKNVAMRNQLKIECNEFGKTVYTYFETGDTQSLVDLFCNINKENFNLSDEIEEAFKFIDGNIISYEETNGFTPSYHYVYDTLSNYACISNINNIKTDNNAVYNIRIKHCLNFDYDENYEGIAEIVITNNLNKSKFSIGKALETIVPREIPDEYMKIKSKKPWQDEYRKVTTMNILYALKSRDSDGLYNLFSENAQNNINLYAEIGAVPKNTSLRAEIEVASSFIRGNIISYSWYHGGSSSSSKREGYWTRISESVDVYDIMTDTGNMYEITYSADHINEEEPTEQGVDCIIIKLVKKELSDSEHMSNVHEVIEEIQVGEW